MGQRRDGRDVRPVYARLRWVQASIGAVRLRWLAGRVRISLLCAVTVVLVAASATAAERSSVRLRISTSGISGSPTLTVKIKTRPLAHCTLVVTIAHRHQGFAAVRASKRGLATITWGVPARAPSGRWIFTVTCKRRHAVGTSASRHRVLTSSPMKGGPLATPGSVSTLGFGAASVFGPGNSAWDAYYRAPGDQSTWGPFCAGGGGKLIASGDGVMACGPTGGTTIDVPGGGSTTGFQCVELSDRFLYISHGWTALVGDGSQVARVYASAHGAPLIRNGTPGIAPHVGDVMSFSDNATFSDPDHSDPGHTGVVIASSVDATGNGSITLLSENVSGGTIGSSSFAVSGWRVADVFGFAYSEWVQSGSGGNGGSTNGGGGGNDTLMIINGGGAAYAKTGVEPALGGFTQETVNSDATAIAAGGSNLAIINGGEAGYAKSGLAPVLGGFTSETAPGDTRAIAISDTGMLAVINGCGAAYAKPGIAPANGGFTQETVCGDAQAIAVGGSNLAIINGCGAAYAKSGVAPVNGGFTQETACGDAKAVAISDTGMLAIINGCGAVYAKAGIAPADGGFTQESVCGDGHAIAVGGSTLMIINGGGAAYAKTGVGPAVGGFTQETANGDATAIAVSASGNTLMIINGCGAAYAKAGIAPADGGFTQETACGDAQAIAAG